jgi:hypothetical protein
MTHGLLGDRMRPTMLDPLGGHPHTAYICSICSKACRSSGGLTQHRNSAHRQFTPEPDSNGSRAASTYEHHPHLTGMYVHYPVYDDALTIRTPARPCNERGEYLPPHTPPQTPPSPPDGDTTNPWNPFDSRIEFDFAYYHFVEAQSSAGLIDKALDLWAAAVMGLGGDTPWKSSRELYATIDAIKMSDLRWKTYTIRYRGPLPPGTPPKWMTQTYELCTRDLRQVLHHQLETAEFKDQINLSPYRQFDSNSQRIWSNLMSADWAWAQAVWHSFGSFIP